ncbi:MAG: hypothetical protein A3B16_01425 [Candidatus Zambryskibacteria bacterium RIFCSPLOWO2_01_FULL_45_43]|uniref:Uncharacterized protein n=1 Tax=Candidatus Zambryskibacteria bacterium RIFCSPLOWO2_01_FULL_45_43 TaxID=1802762 RepID=A0A1G2U5T4_9BACT|nr:MAG: hypothetical protein A3B16_01425 [Candidatus Zambryskibacteria bacterium RIFCSPLOWO2_01_FULL_45_43]
MRLFLSPLLEVGTFIADGRFPGENSLVYSCQHPITASLFSYGVVVFRRPGQHGFDEFLRRLVADGLGYGVEGGAVIQENLADRKMVFGVAGEPVNPQDDKGLDLVFVLPAELQRLQEFLSVIQTQVLGAFAFFPENGHDFKTFLLAVFAAEFLLKFKRGSLDLLVA